MLWTSCRFNFNPLTRTTHNMHPADRKTMKVPLNCSTKMINEIRLHLQICQINVSRAVTRIVVKKQNHNNNNNILYIYAENEGKICKKKKKKKISVKSFCKCFKLKMRERGGGKDSATMHKIQSSLILKTWIFDTILPSSPLSSMHGYCYTLICV